MRKPSLTILAVTATHIGRADFSGEQCECVMGERRGSIGDAVRAALALGKGCGKQVWVLCEDLFTQTVALGRAQVAGLGPDQLARALSFEVEPFSGIPVMESALGFRNEGNADGTATFRVVEMTREERVDVIRLINDRGGFFMGIAHPGTVPSFAEGGGEEWLKSWAPRLRSGTAGVPFIPAPAKAPTNDRYFTIGGLATAAAIVICFGASWMLADARAELSQKQAEFSNATAQTVAANRRNDELRKELANLEKEADRRTGVLTRRGALTKLLHGLATKRPDDVVLREIKADGPSSLVVSGLSIEAGAVDEMSIALTRSLSAAGWSAQPISKTGKKNMANGGPWEFSLSIQHSEAPSTAASLQLSQSDN